MVDGLLPAHLLPGLFADPRLLRTVHVRCRRAAERSVSLTAVMSSEGRIQGRDNPAMATPKPRKSMQKIDVVISGQMEN